MVGKLLNKRKNFAYLWRYGWHSSTKAHTHFTA